MLSMDIDIRQLYRSALLMRYLWEQIRSAFKPDTQRQYDKLYDALAMATRKEMETHKQYAMKCYPNTADPSPDAKAVDVVRKAYRHLLYLTDKSGMGNRMVKSYESSDYASKNIFD